MDTLTLEQLTKRLDRIRLNARERQRRYYAKHRDEILAKKKENMTKLRSLIDEKEKEMEKNEPEPEPEPVIIEKPKTIIIKKAKKNQPLTLDFCQKFYSGKAYTDDENKTINISTAKKYAKNIKAFFEISKIVDLRSIIYDTKKIVDIITNSKSKTGQSYSINTKRDILQSILKLLSMKIIPNFPQSNYLELDNAFKNMNKEKAVVDEQKRSDIRIHKIDYLVDKIIGKYGRNTKESILIQLYALTPKRDDFQLIIKKTDNDIENDKNYIITPTKGNYRIILNRYKTDVKYGSYREILPKQLTDEIKEYIKEKKLKEGNYLLGKQKLAKFIKAMFSKIKGLEYINGVNKLRWSVVASLYNKDNLTLEDAQELARKMLHSKQTQLHYLHELMDDKE